MNAQVALRSVDAIDVSPARYTAMCLAIAACHDVDEIKDWRDKTRALEVYAKQAMNVDAERQAAQVRIRAETRTGELLAELHKATPKDVASMGGHAKAGNVLPATVADSSPYRQAIERANIPPRTAQRFQELAAVKRSQPEDYEAALDAPGVPTTAGVLRAANGATRMDDESLWIWGRLRDFERNGLLQRDQREIFEGMTESMQADVRRLLPQVSWWLAKLEQVSS